MQKTGKVRNLEAKELLQQTKSAMRTDFRSLEQRKHVEKGKLPLMQAIWL